MATHPAPTAAESRAAAYRLRLSPTTVYACRCCREAVRVAAARHLPDTCPSCEAATWTDDGRCASLDDCPATRRSGVRGRAHCHECGYSIWTRVTVRRG